MKILKTIPLLCLLSIPLHGQNTSVSISSIDKQVTELKSKLENCAFKNNTDQDSINVSACFVSGKLYYIEVREKAEPHKRILFFYDNYYLIHTETVWMHPSNGKILNAEKTYHDKGSLIAWLKNEIDFVNSSSEEFIQHEKKLRDKAQEFLEQFLPE
jgi:hypothetical protein